MKSGLKRLFDEVEMRCGEDSKKIGCILGLLVFFISYGMLQEKIMTKPYDDFDSDGTHNTEIFKYSAFLVFSNRIVSLIVVIIILLIKKESFENIAPLWAYSVPAGCNIISTWCQYEALKFLSFPMQTLGKSGKMIMVMIMGALVSKKTYSWKEYLIGLAVTLGCTGFFITGETKSKVIDRPDSFSGSILMVFYLCLDGIVSTTQENLFRGYQMSTHHQMLYINAFAACFSLIGLMARDELIPSLIFCLKHPLFFFDSTGLSLFAMMGQQVIYTVIKDFGALLFSTVMTTRQMISIVLSSLFFSNPLTLYQWICAFLVTGLLYLKGFVKLKPRDKLRLEKNDRDEFDIESQTLSKK